MSEYVSFASTMVEPHGGPAARLSTAHIQLSSLERPNNSGIPSPYECQQIFRHMLGIHPRVHGSYYSRVGILERVRSFKLWTGRSSELTVPIPIRRYPCFLCVFQGRQLQCFMLFASVSFSSGETDLTWYYYGSSGQPAGGKKNFRYAVQHTYYVS